MSDLGCEWSCEGQDYSASSCRGSVVDAVLSDQQLLVGTTHRCSGPPRRRGYIIEPSGCPGPAGDHIVNRSIFQTVTLGVAERSLLHLSVGDLM